MRHMECFLSESMAHNVEFLVDLITDRKGR